MSNKDVTHFITALTSLLSTNFHNFLADILYRNFTTIRCIASPPNVVYVTD